MVTPDLVVQLDGSKGHQNLSPLTPDTLAEQPGWKGWGKTINVTQQGKGWGDVCITMEEIGRCMCQIRQYFFLTACGSSMVPWSQKLY